LIGIEIPGGYAPAKEKPPDALTQLEYSDDMVTWDSNAKASVELCGKPFPASAESHQPSSGNPFDKLPSRTPLPAPAESHQPSSEAKKGSAK
jgi:hypothetical protein